MERSRGSITPQLICDEPFRVFFPLGLCMGLVGVTHWVLYGLGLASTYSCFSHGLILIQGFETCFAMGFLMTALPRFLEAHRAKPYEIAVGIGFLLTTFVGLLVESWSIAEGAFLCALVHLVVFAARRFLRRKDLPPPEFVFVPFGFVCGLAGGGMLLRPGTLTAGRMLVEQGMLLAFVMAAGGYLVPRLLGYVSRPPPAAELATKGLRSGLGPGGRLALYLLGGLLLFGSYFVEGPDSARGLRLVRAAVVSVYFLTVLKVWRMPSRRLWHVRLIFASLYSIMAGLWLYGLFPDYEVMTLHLVFVGGFSTITLAVASRVVTSHCGFEDLWGRNMPAVVLLGICFGLALGLRLSADLIPDAYFQLLAAAAGIWVTGGLVWGIYFVPKLRGVEPSN